MKKKLLNISVLLSLAILFFSFTNIKSGKSKSPKTCYNYVTVNAQGITIVRVQINGVSTIVNIPPGGHHDFYSTSYVQGTPLTISVYLLGEGAAPRMNSLGVGNPYQCITYTNVTQGTISTVKQCETMQVYANNAHDCP